MRTGVSKYIYYLSLLLRRLPLQTLHQSYQESCTKSLLSVYSLRETARDFRLMTKLVQRDNETCMVQKQ